MTIVKSFAKRVILSRQKIAKWSHRGPINCKTHTETAKSTLCNVYDINFLSVIISRNVIPGTVMESDYLREAEEPVHSNTPTLSAEEKRKLKYSALDFSTEVRRDVIALIESQCAKS